jgi:hypothetical protein
LGSIVREPRNVGHPRVRIKVLDRHRHAVQQILRRVLSPS